MGMQKCTKDGNDKCTSFPWGGGGSGQEEEGEEGRAKLTVGGGGSGQANCLKLMVKHQKIHNFQHEYRRLCLQKTHYSVTAMVLMPKERALQLIRRYF